MLPDKKPLIDCETIELAKSGDETAISMIVSRYQNYLMAIASNHLEPYLASRISPSDVVQDTIVGLPKKLRAFAGKTEQELKAWLRASLSNTLKNARRFHLQDKRSVDNEKNFPISRFEDLSTPSKNMQSLERRLELEKGLQKLSKKEQSLLRMRHEAGLSFVEIGETLGTSADAARMAWGRAIEKLKTHLLKRGDL